MNLSEAQGLMEKYRLALKKGTEGKTVLRRATLLPASKAKIKYAYFVFLEHQIQDGEFTPREREQITNEYTQLAYFVEENTLNKYQGLHKDWQREKSNPLNGREDAKGIKQYLAFTHTLGGPDLFREINEFIEELQAQ